MVAEALAIGYVRGKPTYVTDAPRDFGLALAKPEGDSVAYDRVIWFLKAGAEMQPRVIERLDGAKVMFWESYDASKNRKKGIPVVRARDWVAFPPGDTAALRSKPMGQCGPKTAGGTRAGGQRRRWSSPARAMATLDRLYPYAPAAR